MFSLPVSSISQNTINRFLWSSVHIKAFGWGIIDLCSGHIWVFFFSHDVTKWDIDLNPKPLVIFTLRRSWFFFTTWHYFSQEFCLWKKKKSSSLTLRDQGPLPSRHSDSLNLTFDPNLLSQWRTARLLTFRWRALRQHAQTDTGLTLLCVCVCVCVCISITYQSHSSPQRILVGSSSCSPVPEEGTFLRADMGLSRRAPPRLKETDGWGWRGNLGIQNKGVN